MDIAVLGARHIGLVTGAGLASLGHRVWAGERDARRLALHERGEVPFSANAEPVHLAADRRGWELQVDLEAGLEDTVRHFEALA